MKIALAFNLRPEPPGRGHLVDERTCEFDTLHTVNTIASILADLGHSVELVEANSEAPVLFKNKNPDFVFNIAEGIQGADREAQVPALLELMGIPYTGPGPWCAATTLDKRRTKETLQHFGIPTPGYAFVESSADVRGWKSFPAIVKPAREGSSKGIWQRNVVTSSGELKRRIDELLLRYMQPVIVEEFIAGRELTVGMLGNNPRLILPIAEIVFRGLGPGAWPIDSYEAKWIWNGNGTFKAPELRCPARLGRRLESRVRNTALAAFEALDCRDLARLDMRLDRSGTPHVLEVNALPGLIADETEESRFPMMARIHGLSYRDLIGTILMTAVSRHGVKASRATGEIPLAATTDR